MRQIAAILLVYMCVNIYIAHADEKVEKGSIMIREIETLLIKLGDNMDKCTILVHLFDEVPESCFDFIINARNALEIVINNTNITIPEKYIRNN